MQNIQYTIILVIILQQINQGFPNSAIPLLKHKSRDSQVFDLLIPQNNKNSLVLNIVTFLSQMLIEESSIEKMSKLIDFVHFDSWFRKKIQQMFTTTDSEFLMKCLIKDLSCYNHNFVYVFMCKFQSLLISSVNFSNILLGRNENFMENKIKPTFSYKNCQLY